MFIRATLLAALSLCAASFAAAQTGAAPPPNAAAQTGRTWRPEQTTVTGVYAPTVASSTISCGRISYTVSVNDGACSQFSNPDADGQPTPPDYAHCTNSRGDNSAASCRFGCAPTTGTGKCLTIRDHR